MNVEQKIRLWTYTKFFGMFLVGIVFAVLAQAVAQTTTDQQAKQTEEESFADCMSSASSLLTARQQALSRRLSDVEGKEEDLEAAKKHLEAQIKELHDIRDEIDQKMKEMDATKMEKVKGLVSRFEKVRPKQAAAILEKTDDDVSVLVLEQMSAAKSGKIMAAMTPDKAAYLTERLAQHPMKVGEKSQKGN